MTEAADPRHFVVVEMYDGCVMADLTFPITEAKAREYLRRHWDHYTGKHELGLMDTETGRLVSFRL